MTYFGGTNYRQDIGGKVLNTGSEPAHLDLAQHNEMSYLNKFPGIIAFCGIKPSNVGGHTSISDNRKVTKNLPKNMYERFDKEGVKYVRNFSSAEFITEESEYFYKDWQSTFGSDKTKVELTLKELENSWSWGENNKLKVWYVGKAFTNHPITGEKLFFNPSFSCSVWLNDWHPFNKLPYEEQPFPPYWGNGDKFSEEELNILKSLYDNETISEPYEEGDIIVLDNILYCHGRTKYSGERIVGVFFGNPTVRL